MGLGVKARSDSFRISLTIHGAAPTGTPQIWILGPLYLTDLASDVAGTGISSATGGFESGMVNGKLHILNDDTGFTVGSYSISVYTDTNNITIGSSAGASKTGGIGIVNAATILAATNMIQGASTYIWYYDYKIASDATIGQYQVYRSAVIDGVTYYSEEDFTVSPTAVTVSGSEYEQEENYD